MMKRSYHKRPPPQGMVRQTFCYGGEPGCRGPRCIRARRGDYTCGECGDELRPDGFCGRCDALSFDVARELWRRQGGGALAEVLADLAREEVVH